MKTQLKKGATYATVLQNGVGVGVYIGRLNGFYLFNGGSFCFDCGCLSGSVKVEDIDKLNLVEIPMPHSETGAGTMSYLMSVLPK